jgi:glycosyltransferase involved in cell wall biosynthesis
MSEKQLRILYIIPYFYPAWEYGGPVRVTYAISRKLVERGHEVVVYTSDTGGSNLGVKSRVKDVDGVKVYYFRNISTIIAGKTKLFSTMGMVPTARKEIGFFDVIHLHEYRTFQNWVVHHYAKKYNVPYVLQAHGSLPRIDKKRLKLVYDVFFGYRLLRDASKVIALNQMEAQQCMDVGVPEEKIETIPNGIDLSEYSNLPPKGAFKKKFFIGDNEKIILYLGRVHKRKGIDFLLDAFSRLNYKRTVLVIAGADDGYMDFLKEKARTLNVSEKLILTGFVSEKTKLAAYVDSEVVVYPGIHEAFAIVPLEAALCSKPVIVSDDSIMAEIVSKGGFGFSIKYRDVAQLRDLLLKILNNHKSADEMGKKGRDFVKENYKWGGIVSQLEQVYSTLVGN